MIVDSMTLREIHRELHDDLRNLGGTLENRRARFRSAVLKSSRYPVRRRYECTSLGRKNRFYAMFTACRRSEHSDPTIEFYCIFDRPEGLFCALLDAGGRNTFVFPPHFFARYRERVVGGSGMSGPDMIHHFISRLWGISLAILPDGDTSYTTWDEVFKAEKVDVMGACPDGIMFGERTEDVYLLKTIVTRDMLFEDQLDDYEDLYDHYYDMIYRVYPEKVADFIIDLEPDYYRPREEPDRTVRDENDG